MAEYRKHYDETPGRHEREWPDRASDEVRRERGGYWRLYEQYRNVIDGEVTLSGSVMSRDQKRCAEDVAERISGVKDVTNRLRVTRNGNGHDWAPDSSRAAGLGTTSSQPVSEASGKGTPSKTTSGTSA